MNMLLIFPRGISCPSAASMQMQRFLRVLVDHVRLNPGVSLLTFTCYGVLGRRLVGMANSQ